MSDLVERLEDASVGYPNTWDTRPILAEAAAEIARLREREEDLVRLLSDVAHEMEMRSTLWTDIATNIRAALPTEETGDAGEHSSESL